MFCVCPLPEVLQGEGTAGCRVAAGQQLKLFLRQVRLRHAEEV